jgi:diguanylate cyclase (GGDEF)-like protein
MSVRDGSGKPLRMAGSQTDITEGKVADPLTGLPNRLLFNDRLLRLIEHHHRSPESLFAVLFLDLDGFKMVNDSLGHLMGDKLLISVASRFMKCLRHTDTVARIDETFTVARLGGDEFAILLGDLKDLADAIVVAERLMHELSQPFILDEKEIFTSVSIGIAFSHGGYQLPEEFLRDADTAMYHAKARGKARYEVFDADMRASITHRLELETDLRHALERREFRNFYQPIISLESGKIAGFEALLRWQHPTRGLVGPSEFIPIAEETGMIREVGWWSLSEACHQIAKWREVCLNADLTISVNLSVKQFLQPNFAAFQGNNRLIEVPEFTTFEGVTQIGFQFEAMSD